MELESETSTEISYPGGNCMSATSSKNWKIWQRKIELLPSKRHHEEPDSMQRPSSEIQAAHISHLHSLPFQQLSEKFVSTYLALKKNTCRPHLVSLKSITSAKKKKFFCFKDLINFDMMIENLPQAGYWDKAQDLVPATRPQVPLRVTLWG